MSAGEVTLARRPRASRASPCRAVTASPTCSSRSLQTTTEAPSEASLRAAARPMPRAPVTIATLPMRSATYSSFSTLQYLDPHRETPFLPRAHKHGGTVAYRLCYTVGRVTRERLQANVVVASVPRVEPRRAVLLPEPQIRHLLDIPLDSERQSLFRVLHLVPALREVLEVEHLAHSSCLRQHAQVHAGARLVFDDGPGVSSAVI